MPLLSRSPRLKSRSRTGWIGIDLGTHSIKLAQVELANARWQLVEASAIPLPASAAINPQSLETGWLAALLREELSLRRAFRGRRAACVLSMAISDFRSVNLPSASSGETREMIAQELTDSGMGGSDTLEFDFWSTSRSNSEPEASAIVDVISVSRSVATQIARQMLDAGLMCQVLDGLPFALARSVQILAESNSDNSPVGVLDWGNLGTNFSVAIAGQPAFTRVLKDCGMQQLSEAVCRGLELPLDDCHTLLSTHGVPGAEDAVPPISEVQELVSEIIADPWNRLVAELEKTLSYLGIQRPELVPPEIWLVGGGAAIRNAADKLTAETGIRFRPWCMPRRPAAIAGFTEQPIELFASAAALSQLGLQS